MSKAFEYFVKDGADTYRVGLYRWGVETNYIAASFKKEATSRKFVNKLVDRLNTDDNPTPRYRVVFNNDASATVIDFRGVNKDVRFHLHNYTATKALADVYANFQNSDSDSYISSGVKDFEKAILTLLPETEKDED